MKDRYSWFNWKAPINIKNSPINLLLKRSLSLLSNSPFQNLARILAFNDSSPNDDCLDETVSFALQDTLSLVRDDDCTARKFFAKTAAFANPFLLRRRHNKRPAFLSPTVLTRIKRIASSPANLSIKLLLLLLSSSAFFRKLIALAKISLL